MCKLNVNLIKSKVSGKYVLSVDSDELKIINLGLQQLAGSNTLVNTTDAIDADVREYASLMVDKLLSQRKSVG